MGFPAVWISMRSAFRRLAFAVIDTVVYVVKLARDFQTMTRSLHLIRETVASRHPIELFLCLRTYYIQSNFWEHTGVLGLARKKTRGGARTQLGAQASFVLKTCSCLLTKVSVKIRAMTEEAMCTGLSFYLTLRAAFAFRI